MSATSTITESLHPDNDGWRAAADSVQRPLPSMSRPGDGLTTDTIELAPMTQSSSTEPLRLTSSPSLKTAARNETIALACVCWCFFLEGFNDGTLGPLLPRIQEYFGLGFTLVSILFIASAIVGSIFYSYISLLKYCIPGIHLRFSDQRDRERQIRPREGKEAVNFALI